MRLPHRHRVVETHADTEARIHRKGQMRNQRRDHALEPVGQRRGVADQAGQAAHPVDDGGVHRVADTVVVDLVTTTTLVTQEVLLILVSTLYTKTMAEVQVNSKYRV